MPSALKSCDPGNPLDDPDADPFAIAKQAAAQLAAATGVERYDIASHWAAGGPRRLT